MANLENETLDKLVAGYVKVRDRKAELEAEHKAKVSKLDDMLNELGATIGQRLRESNVTSAKTAAGTATLSSRSIAMCGDWSALYEWITTTGRFDILERRIKVGAVKEIAEEEGKMPPGVKLDTKEQVMVRRVAATK